MWMSEARGSSALDQVIDEPDDRRLAGEVLEALDVLGFVGIGSRLDVIDDLSEHGLAAAIQPFDGRQDLGTEPERRFDGLAVGQFKGMHHVAVLRRGHGDQEPVGVFPDRHHMRGLQELDRDLLLTQRRLGIIRGADERQVQEDRERLGQVAIREEPELDQHGAQVFAATVGEPDGVLQTLAGDLAVGEEVFTEARGG